ncbi:MAG: 16S rRNA (cytosine(967)-C(5))-methyltransferase RsmB [Clostridia bacterium]|nr:16S rRNA (cytosine(967)-C(5))-methyltransferase RsmB [Clostridia bacterium]
MNIRKLALDMMLDYEISGKYVNLSLSSHMLDKLTDSERGQLTSLLYTAVEHKITYDYLIASLSGRSIEDVDDYTRALLRLGLCQIIHINSVPDFAATNETVKLARNPGERSFVNGVLRSAVRNKENLPIPNKGKNYRRYLSVKYSFPLWIVKHFALLFGDEGCERILEFYNTEKYTDISVNLTKCDGSSLKEKYGAYSVINNGLSLRIDGSINPEKAAGFAQGDFFVQDTASATAVSVLEPRAGDRLIDVCSAPGGKSFAAAVLMENKGEIYSFDLHESKLTLIESGAKRLGLDIINVAMRDATCPDETLIGTADKVICDVPCSGLGVLGKKPDLRYKDEANVKELPPLQLKILRESAKYLKIGGELLYSTCTLNPDENENVVKAFIEENPSFELVDFKAGGLSSDGGMLTLLPHVHKTDGFFMAKLKRK